MTTERYEMEDADAEPPMPELKLALAIVLNAIKDVRTGARVKRRYEQETLYVMHQLRGDDAKDFLLRRLNEAENHWGRVLREYGMRPMTPQRLAYLMRYRPLKSHTGSMTMEGLT